MAKRVTIRPEWIQSEQVVDVYSVSNCVSNDFADYISYWKHNGFWFFDSPEIIRELVMLSQAREERILSYGWGSGSTNLAQWESFCWRGSRTGG
jgi:hypothetical protein